MKIEGTINIEYPKPAKKEKKEIQLPVDSGAPKSEHASEGGVEAQKAQKVAQRLNELPQNSVRFIVRDPNSSKPHNVVIQIENRDGQVVATIPSEVVLKMADASDMEFREASKGLVVDQISR